MEWANQGADHFGTVLLPGLPLQFPTQIILSFFSLCTCYHTFALAFSKLVLLGYGYGFQGEGVENMYLSSLR
jgi:hypothetical protein